MHAQQQPAAPPDGAQANDFNDLASAAGPDQVRDRIAAALESIEADAKPKPKGPHYRLDAAGVWFQEMGEDGEPGATHWICAPLHVVAKTRDAQNEDWGRMLRWNDADGALHTWAAPVHLLIGDGRDFARELASRGLEIAPGTQSLKRLLAYVITEPAASRARCIPAPGWYGRQYVLPTGEAFGKGEESIVYQHSGGLSVHYGSAGDWRANIATQCVGNSRLIFAACSMFAGPMLRMAGMEGGGIHFIGSSSTGKSTLLKVAASVAGPPKYAREWRATANGLEGVATLHNDATLILDEISQMDAGQAGEAVYLLANGTGKSRATRSGDARPAAQWLVQTLSAGEVSLAQHMAQAGKQVRAGQLVRLADVPVDAGAGLGAFEALHGATRGDTFAVRLGLLCSEHYGTAWRPWLAYLADKATQAISAQIKREIDTFKQDCVPERADGQVIRVAARFGLCAVAGELATLAGLTGWPPGESRRAAKACFRDWLTLRGGAQNGEHLALMAQVRAFFETHGESRFDPAATEQMPRSAAQRAGFHRPGPFGDLQYLVMREAFKRELCKGFDHRQAIRWLTNAKWLLPGGDGHNTQLVRIRSIGGQPIRLYVFDAATVHGTEGAEPAADVCPF
jgi:putative DNA primase/helicase